jgi:hypothetical protein
MPADGLWRQTGSGCLLVGKRKYPCDVEYERRKRQADGSLLLETFTVFTTVEAIETLPLRTRDSQAVAGAPGVRLAGWSWLELPR